MRIRDAEKEMAELYSEVRHQEALVESLRIEVCVAPHIFLKKEKKKKNIGKIPSVWSRGL